MSRSPVTRSQLLQYGTEYRYDADVGEFGAFHYYMNGSAVPNHTVVFQSHNIGAIVSLSDNITSADVQDIFFTTIELPNVPTGTPYGWSHNYDCWAYFTNGTDQLATYMSRYS